jgi:tight adherence protein C
MALLILVVAGLAALALAAGAVLMLMQSRGFDARLSAVGGAPSARPGRKKADARRTLDKLAVKVSKGSVDEAERGALKLKLLQAGFSAEKRVEYFFAARVGCAVLGAAAGVVAALALKLASPLVGLLIVMAAATLGLYLPPTWLKGRIKARVEQVQLAMPDAIDLMVVCVEAGSTLNAAMQRVEQELVKLHPVLSEHFRATLLEIQVGAGWADALRRLAERAPADELRALVSLLVQSEALGASLGQTLRVFAEEMRTARFLRAEEKAAELPVKIAFPLVFLIFPCLMGVIFTPVIIRFARVLFQVNTG